MTCKPANEPAAMGAHKFLLEGAKKPKFPDGVSTEMFEGGHGDSESVALYLRGAIIGTK